LLNHLISGIKNSKLATRFLKFFSPTTTPILPALWASATANYEFVQRLSLEDQARLRHLASTFLSRKTISGADGQAITDLVRVQIAAQACILILNLGLEYYDGWHEIILYPAQFTTEREYTDGAGVVHRTRSVLAGEAWLQGPVVLSYEDVTNTEGAHNVVIHEFAHKIDMLNGGANGYPPLHKGLNREKWKQTFLAAYLQFCEAVDKAEMLPRRQAHAALDAIPIDPYAAENPAEFFAVCSEVFFEAPEVLAQSFPAVFVQLALFYKQNPVKSSQIAV
jgi:MtfA peptidase